MNPSSESNLNTKDHDLLIRLDENMKAVLNDVRSLRDDTTNRVLRVEERKLDKEDFETFKKALMTELTTAEITRKETFSGYQQLVSKALTDYEDRIRKIERIVYIAIGVSLIVQIVVDKLPF